MSDESKQVNLNPHMDWLVSNTAACDMRGAILGILACYPVTLAEREAAEKRLAELTTTLQLIGTAAVEAVKVKP